MIFVTLVTGRSGPEICGTGEQGGSVDGLRLLVRSQYPKALYGFLWVFNHYNELLTEKVTCYVATIGLSGK